MCAASLGAAGLPMQNTDAPSRSGRLRSAAPTAAHPVSFIALALRSSTTVRSFTMLSRASARAQHAASWMELRARPSSSPVTVSLCDSPSANALHPAIPSSQPARCNRKFSTCRSASATASAAHPVWLMVFPPRCSVRSSSCPSPFSPDARAPQDFGDSWFPPTCRERTRSWTMRPMASARAAHPAVVMELAGTSRISLVRLDNPRNPSPRARHASVFSPQHCNRRRNVWTWSIPRRAAASALHPFTPTFLLLRSMSRCFRWVQVARVRSNAASGSCAPWKSRHILSTVAMASGHLSRKSTASWPFMSSLVRRRRIRAAPGWTLSQLRSSAYLPLMVSSCS
mmetsp:Transcript_3225/g.7679  ORF Transcript_3225/g.7679 Transcript_3225/m.7679 type:complete len:341 (-) Transcript_3225:366-1388(-)